MIEVNTHCKYCLKEMDAKSVRAVFCSSKCRVYFRREKEYKSRNKPFTGATVDDFKPVLATIIEKEGKRIGNKAKSKDKVVLKPQDIISLDISSVGRKLHGLDVKCPPMGLSKTELAVWRRNNS